MSTLWMAVAVLMRCVIGYPSLDDPRGFVQVGQNRQSKIFSVGEEAAIYPYVPAMAATILSRTGHEVLWSDGPSEGLSWSRQLEQLQAFDPDLVAWEAKTPSIKRLWEKARELKAVLPHTKIVLFGDHVTAQPEESLNLCPASYIITGGDYDLALEALIKIIDEPTTDRIFRFPTTNKLDHLPVVDRKLTKWKLYSRMGNYLYRPGTHGYSARDCWWRSGGGCTFCSWTNTYKNYRTMSVDQFMADVESAHALGAREYFDDAGTWAPPGKWFEEALVATRKFNQARRHFQARVCLGCNDRPGARSKQHYEQMASSGFRFILYGLESANLETLKRINKGQKAEDMRNAAKWASEAGLQPHLTVMFGYPWESTEDATRTVSLVQELFNRGWANSMQATLLMPYPGTALFHQAEDNGWLLTHDWNRYTMNECILQCPMSHEEVLAKIRACYKAAVTPRYILKKVLTVRTRDDLQFFWRGFKFWFGHLTDFSWRTHA